MGDHSRPDYPPEEVAAEMVGWEGEVLAEIAQTLAALDKKHPDALNNTPPMMYREWILCVVAQAKEAGRAEATPHAEEVRGLRECRLLVEQAMEWSDHIGSGVYDWRRVRDEWQGQAILTLSRSPSPEQP